jgi:hypothetical protein
MPTPSIVAKNHHNSSIIGVSSIELISQLSSRTSTPNAMNADEADLFLEDFDVEVQGDTSAKADISVPDWFSLDLDTIYDTLNPRTKQGTSELRSWRKKCVDAAGKPLTSIGIVANRLLKILTTRKLLSDTPLNSKLQTKKVERQQQKEQFTSISNASNAQASLMIIRKFLAHRSTAATDNSVEW